MKFIPNLEGLTCDAKELMKRYEPQNQNEKSIQKIFEQNLKWPTWGIYFEWHKRLLFA